LKSRPKDTANEQLLFKVVRDGQVSTVGGDVHDDSGKEVDWAGYYLNKCLSTAFGDDADAVLSQAVRFRLTDQLDSDGDPDGWLPARTRSTGIGLALARALADAELIIDFS
jgi:hypothetical protein